MKEILRYFALILIGLSVIYYFNREFKTGLDEVQKQFDKTELTYLEELAVNITRTLQTESNKESLFEFLSSNPSKRITLERILETIAISKYKYAYVVTKNENGRLVFLLDGALKDKSSFLEPFFSQSEEWDKIFETSKPIYFQEKDIDSIWMTYLYPIKKDNKIEAILAIDFSKKTITDTLNYFIPLQEFLDNLLTVFIISFILLIIFILQYLLKNKESLKHKQEIIENQEFFKEVFDSQTSIIVTIQNDKITNANKVFFDFFNVKSIDEFEERVGSLYVLIKPLEKFSIDTSRDNWILSSLETHKSYETKIGSNIFTVTGKNIIYQNEPLLILSITDVTKLENTMQEAKQANIAKSEFLAKMSHEIRTPMNAIMGLTTLMIESNIKEKNIDYLTKIKNSSNLLLNIINEILDFSKIESGKLELHNTSFQLISLVDKLKNIFEVQAKEKNLEFNILLDQSLPECLIADQVRLEQVLINLLGNAIKFTHSGNVELLIKSSNTSQCNIIFEIKDTGIGIAQEKQKLLFEAFVQADNSITREYGGTGLGLSITKQIVELMNGTIQLNSVENEGTIFTIKLFLEYDEQCIFYSENSENSVRNELLKYKDIFILIAEDNLFNQDVIKGILEPFEFNLTLVNNGKGCLEKCHSNKYDIIFMDINMPIMGGFESTQNIRDFGINTPIIALSANARKEDIQKSIDSGMNEHITKPINPNLLYSSMLKYLPIEKKHRLKKIHTEKDNSEKFTFNYFDGQKLLNELSFNIPLFETILKRFLNDYKNCKEIIENLQKEKDFEKMKDFFHKFKSTSGTIKAIKLFPLVDDYYELLQDGVKDDFSFEKIIQENENVISELNNFFNSKRKKEDDKDLKLEKSQIDINQLNNFDSLKIALETKNLNKIKVAFSEIDETKLSSENRIIFEHINSLIKNYKFNDALRILEK
jgi:signal transduction histidine kinase/CheY-like chemotaxis protein